jgi:hypothetical protein
LKGKSGGGDVEARLFSLALGKPESDFQTVKLIFFIDVLNESLQVSPGFIGSRGSFFNLGHNLSL